MPDPERIGSRGAVVRIAIVGSGISGMVCAKLLRQEHEVVVFEANDYVGGHTHTVEVDIDGIQYAVDTGFIVFNEKTYPNFCALIDELGVESQPTSMSFSVRCDKCGLEYAGNSIATLFAQRRNALSLRHYRMLRDILRFHKHSIAVIDQLSHEMTVAEFVQSYGYSMGFLEHYLLPMGAAIWSCPTATFERFPVRFMIEFFRNHGMLQVRDRPIWRTITGGSKNYVARIISGFRDAIRLETPVRRVARTESGVTVATDTATETFDEVIFACHSDQALKLLTSPSAAEREVLTKFPYSRNVALLHNDDVVLPRRKTTWSSWNYRIPIGKEIAPCVTYNMNILQRLDASQTILVTLNNEESIDSGRILGKFDYSHPVFTTERRSAQARHQELIRAHHVSYCGAYWGNGFHEDGVNSALAVCSRFGIRPTWQVRSRADQQRASVGRIPVGVA